MINFFSILELEENIEINSEELRESFEKLQKKATINEDYQRIYDINQAYNELLDEKKRIEHFLEINNLKKEVENLQQNENLSRIVNEYYQLYSTIDENNKKNLLNQEKEKIKNSLKEIKKLFAEKDKDTKKIAEELTQISYSKRLIEHLEK